jgi:hypothetical protein
MDVVLPSGYDSSVSVNAVILDDRTAAGDEAETAAMFRYRAAYAAEWQRWSLVLPANGMPDLTEQSEIQRMLKSPANSREEAATAAGVTAARRAIGLLLQGSSPMAARGYLTERAAQLRLHAERAGASSIDALSANANRSSRIESLISTASVLRVPDATPLCSPASVTSTSSSPASTTTTEVRFAYIPGIGCAFADTQTATLITRTFDRRLFSALDNAGYCFEPPPSLTYIDFKNSLMTSFKRVDQYYKSVGSYSGKTIRFSFETDPPGATIPSSQIAWGGQASGSAQQVDVTFSSAGTFTVSVTVSGVSQSASVRVIDQPSGIGQDAYAALHPIDTATALYYNLIGTTTTSLEPFIWANAQYPGLQQNTIADAARHTYWNCTLAVYTNPGYAEGITYNHEVSSPGPATETIMDLNNNAAGRAVAAGLSAANQNLAGCRAAVISAISSGSATIYLDGSYGTTNTREDALLKPTNR